MRREYDRAAAGEGRVVLLEGGEGAGKTRLVDEMVSLLEAEGKDLSFRQVQVLYRTYRRVNEEVN